MSYRSAFPLVFPCSYGLSGRRTRFQRYDFVEEFRLNTDLVHQSNDSWIILHSSDARVEAHGIQAHLRKWLSLQSFNDVRGKKVSTAVYLDDICRLDGLIIFEPEELVNTHRHMPSIRTCRMVCP